MKLRPRRLPSGWISSPAPPQPWTSTPRARTTRLPTDGFLQGKVNFGAGNNLGGTFVVNRIAGPAFNLATQLHFFDLYGPGVNTPDNQNQAVPGFTPAPAS